MTRSSAFLAGRAQMRIVVITAILISLLLLSYTTSPIIVKHVDPWITYEPTIHDADPTDSCSERFGLGYLRRLGENAVEHCSSNSTSRFSCFSYTTRDDRIDSFCYGSPAMIEDGRVGLACDARDWDEEPIDGEVQHLESMEEYWYNTGVRPVLNGAVDLHRPDLPVTSDAPPRTYLLVQREGTVANLWHTLMQVMSLGLSIDILRNTSDPKTGAAYLSSADLKNTQILITDDHAEGPFWNIWQMYADLPMLRLRNISSDLTESKMVIPLPGASNTLWEGDWTELTCERSALLNGFVRRVLNFYHLGDEPAKSPTLRLTFIDRQGSRKLQHQAVHFSNLQSAFPDVEIQLVDFANITFAEQLQLIRKTDILVGVHGAGLTHEFFLPINSTVVEIQPPDMNHRGFFNMATFLGHEYFRVAGHDFEYEGRKGDWHDDDIAVDENWLLDAVEAAIAATRRLRS
ncbi:glycosyltransferase family 61 protein [Dissoconium aciculare CBS 342.82]|uniref:EGF domain-specific O-linked N-acetylglucosamine transferase n=1 Tax=Dissoconium aciculare CBS 342.82 TaxID=1314786 RepID=A0A6J3M8W7_9PEZI|nr:glycosyltransferase family 61 protein [Dissoconium aciculare CBS 342.82]KAF1824445.1 glycosyltransferase family 61 protein [Dissoconium aciculare CBS 342.82]